MIDITKVQTFNVPKEITVLQKQNGKLIRDNEELSKNLKLGIGVFTYLIIVGGFIFYNYNKTTDEKRK